MKDTSSPFPLAIQKWYRLKKWKPFAFQQEVMEAYLEGKSGLLNAPTGSGKTYALWLPTLAEYMREHPSDYAKHKPSSLQVLWITPLRALARDIRAAMQSACDDLGIPWAVELRTGDTSPAQRKKQKQHMPECLVTTPESLHILLSQAGYASMFRNLKTVVVDEWHELLGNKRGVQMELALSRLRGLRPELKVWGISATIGNLEQAKQALIGTESEALRAVTIKADIEKKIHIETVIPQEIEKFPWSGHLGIKLLPEIISIIDSGQTTLLFTNTRSQTEIWYQHLLLAAPHLAGAIAMHHGSLDNELRNWVENALHEGRLKVVVCTSTLDLGVDFRPVDIVIQVGGPKGVSRFLQRAGRSGHQPGKTSKIYFVPTNSLELVEGAAIKEAIRKKMFESKIPLEMSLDVMVQYMVTLAVSEGFMEAQLYQEVKTTNAFRNLQPMHWEWALNFITTGGKSLTQYDEFSKVVLEDGLYRISTRKMAMRHRLSIGTIVGDPVLKVQYMGGKNIGTIEESFISGLKKGDVFWFAGRNLEYVRIKDLAVLVKTAGKKKGIIPQWNGGRMPLSSQLSEIIREKLEEAKQENTQDVELIKLKPLFDIQKKWSAIPASGQLLIEHFQSNEGYHLFVFPFEGRYVHQVMASMIAYRICKVKPLTFSIAMNDYGFELLSDQEIPLETAIDKSIFSIHNYMEDLQAGINHGEMARRRFRDIAAIAGLVFQGYPGKYVSYKHIQSSSQLFFDVFLKYEPDNLLIRQSFEEVLSIQLEQSRLGEAMKRIAQQELLITKPPKPTPFAFPIMTERFRESMSTEKLEARITRMQVQLEKAAMK